jgi:hypothetical protein
MDVISEDDKKDWEQIKEILEEVRTSKTKYDVLYWSDRKNCGYIIRASKK